jgi:hypothetical protein
LTLKEFVTVLGWEVDEQGLKAYDDAIARIYEKTDGLTKHLHRAAEGLVAVGSKLSLYLSAPIAGLATVSVMAKMKMEDLQNEWGVMLGSQQQGIEFTKEMLDLEDKTPYNKEQIHAYAKELHAMGVQSDKILPRMKMFFDIAAGTGLDAGFLMQSMQQIQNMGFVMGRQLRTLIASGAIDRVELERMTGVHGIKNLMAIANKGKISAGMIERIFEKQGLAGGKYFGKSEERANTLKKSFERLFDSIFKLRAAIGDIIVKNTGFANILKRVTEWIDRLTERIDKLSPGMKKFLLIVGGAAFALGPALVGLGKMLLIFEKLSLVMIGLKAAGGIAGILKMAGGIGGALWAALGPIALISAGLMTIYLLFQDIWMYLKYGKDASLFGSVFEDVGAKLHQGVQAFIDWVKSILQGLRNWWDLLWHDPWAAIREAFFPTGWADLFKWLGGGLPSAATASTQYPATLPGMFTPAVGSTLVNTNVTVNMVAPDGTTEQGKASLKRTAEEIFGFVIKKATDSIHNQIKPSGG